MTTVMARPASMNIRVDPALLELSDEQRDLRQMVAELFDGRSGTAAGVQHRARPDALVGDGRAGIARHQHSRRMGRR